MKMNKCLAGLTAQLRAKFSALSMTKVALSLIAVMSLVGVTSCTEKPSHPKWTYDAVVYEMNVRQYTPEGTFAAAEQQLPRLKELGVDVLWLMPIYPIGEKERKGTLGSYYAVKDYCAVNPEFGTMEDFESFLSEAKSLGFKVILDWVANHTSPDAVWITESPADWYERDSLGNTIVQYDWTDIAALNYDNPDVWDAQLKSMRFWMEKGIDGFRCDMACEVPFEFWKKTIAELRAEWPQMYMLAEGEDPELHRSGFDASYAWELHHLLNDIAQEKKGIAELLDYVERDSERFPDDAFRLMFTSNHDENSWAGTEFERMGDAARAMAVLTFTLPCGQPLVYTGQEMGWNHRFAFFEKDPVPEWKKNDFTEFYNNLICLRHSHPALRPGEKGGRFEVVSTEDSTLVFRRVLEDDVVTVSVQMHSPWGFNIVASDEEVYKGFAPESVVDAAESQVHRVEPLSWWIGMNTPLQLLVNGEGISEYEVSIEGPYNVVNSNCNGKFSGGCCKDECRKDNSYSGVCCKDGCRKDNSYSGVCCKDRDNSCGGNSAKDQCHKVKVTSVHKADSPNYLFVDISVPREAEAGTYYLVFKGHDGKTFKREYVIADRREGSRLRSSFSSADMIYLIMPDRFANGDSSNDSTPYTAEKADRSAFFGRHGGDIQGMIDHLDYISELGATAIWPTPLLEDNAPEESYHGYAASDYYHIDPRFGDNELYREFVEKAHSKGLKVLMDIVTNHCGTSHWWMKDLPFEDWIHQFPEYTATNVCFSTNMDTNASEYDLNIQESGWFVPSMPDMNLDNPFVLNYFTQWAVWWAEYAGLDGFRVDTYPYNEKEPMSRWCKAITDEYPNFNIVGECWTSSIPQLAYWQMVPSVDISAECPECGCDLDNISCEINAKINGGFNSNLPSVMDFPLHDALRAALNEHAGWGCGMTRIYETLSHDFLYHNVDNLLIFCGNHDTDRIGDVVGKNPEKLKLAMTLMATLRGIPQVFAGDELMLVSADRSQGHGGLRVDFPGGWADDKVNLFTEEGRKAQKVNTDGKQVTKGQAEELFDYVSRLFNWRKTAEVIHTGKTLHFITRDNTYAFFRHNKSSAVFVFINNSDEPKRVPWSHYSEIASVLADGVNVITGDSCVVNDDTVVAASSALVVEYKRL